MSRVSRPYPIGPQPYQQVVLWLSSQTALTARFLEKPRIPRPIHEFKMPMTTWLAMDRPEVITVTLESGNKVSGWDAA